MSELAPFIPLIVGLYIVLWIGLYEYFENRRIARVQAEVDKVIEDQTQYILKEIAINHAREMDRLVWAGEIDKDGWTSDTGQKNKHGFRTVEKTRDHLLKEYGRDFKRKLYFGHLPEEQQRKMMP